MLNVYSLLLVLISSFGATSFGEQQKPDAPQAIQLDKALLGDTLVFTLDKQVLLSKSIAAMKIKDQFEKFLKEKHGEISKEEIRLREEYLNLRDKDTKDIDRIKIQQEFGKKVNELKAKADFYKEIYYKAYTGGLELIQNNIDQIIAKLSPKGKKVVVLNPKYLVYFSEGFDITTIVVKELNRILPEVKFVVEN